MRNSGAIGAFVLQNPRGYSATALCDDRQRLPHTQKGEELMADKEQQYRSLTREEL